MPQAQLRLKRQHPSGMTCLSGFPRSIHLHLMNASYVNSENRQRALFTLSRMALRETEISSLIQESVRIIAAALNGERVSIFESSRDGQNLILRASSTASSAVTIEPLVSDDLRSVNITISGQDEDNPFGLLEATANDIHRFTPGDVKFLQTSADIIAAAIHRSQLEAQLKNKVLELHLAHRKKDDFLANLSHELRNPLNVILGYLEMIREMDRNSTEFDQALTAIERNAKSEAKLVLDILELSRIMTGKMRMEMSLFSLIDSLDSAVRSVQFAANAKGIEIKLSCQQSITRYFGDKDRLQQVIWNLLANAVKFTPAGGTITLRTTQIHDALEIAVQDSGIGIAPENLSFVFDRFWQEDSGLNRKHQGMGLGLSIVRQIVELHGGTVSVESAGRSLGTCFKVRLPFVPAAIPSPDGSPGAVEIPAPVVNRDLNGIRMLVIDDSEDALILLKVLLETRGALVHAASSPAEGLREAMSQEFDLMISDIGMPEMDGYMLMRKFREWEQTNGRTPRPAIALSGFAGEADAVQTLSAGFSCHLTKPLNRELLETTIIRILGAAELCERQRSTRL